MGLFYETKLHPDVEDAVRRASTGVRRGEGDVEGDVARLALLHGSPRKQEIQWPRLLMALGLVGILAAAAVTSEAHDLHDATDALWGLTTATFGLVVGLLGGEKAAA